MEIVIFLYKGFTALDAIGPYEVVSRLPNAKVKFAAKQKGIIESEYPSLKLVAEYALSEIKQTDILLVPGSTQAFLGVSKDKEVLNEIRRIDATTQWTTSVCSGSVILAATGLLNGVPATSHWGALKRLEELGAQPVKERYVRHGKFVTGAGVSAGIDMALYLTTLLEGESYAQMVQLVVEYYPNPPLATKELGAVPTTVVENAKQFLQKEMKMMSGA